MSRLFYHVMQDNVGNLLFDVSGTMRLAGTGTVATIYGDEALTIPIANPMTNHPSFGSFKCFLPSGDFDFYMAKSGYTFETLTGVQGLGTMAQQDASAVAITGGSVQGLTVLEVVNSPGADVFGLLGRIGAAAEANRYNLYMQGTAPNFMQGPLGLGMVPSGAMLGILFARPGTYGLALKPNADSGAGEPLLFLNAANAGVGSVSTTATTTAYNTTSDARLKTAVEPLRGALEVVRSLKPITHRWKVDDSPGVGLLADEVQAVIPAGVVSGNKDAVDDEGQIVPQMIDYSKLVPWLVSACQDLAQQVEALTARLETAGR